MNRRINPTGGQIYQAYIRSGGQCAICSKVLGNLYHIDHIKPIALGGQTVIQNLQALCPECNLKKGSRNEAI